MTSTTTPLSPKTQAAEEDDDLLFSCRCESAKSVSTLLSCLRHVSSSTASGNMHDFHSERKSKSSPSIQPVTVFCTPSSLTFHVYGLARQSQASVDLQVGLFSHYHVGTTTTGEGEEETRQQGGEFCVNLSTVLECLHILGTASLEKTKLSMSFSLATEIFKMELLEDGASSVIAIPGMLPPHDTGKSLALAFRSSPIVGRIICKSEWLALGELELVQGATCCTVALGPSGLELAAVGNLGECFIALPESNLGSSIVSLEASTAVEARTYPLHSFLSGMRGLEYASETCLSLNQAGMIAIQHQVLDSVGNGSPNFVDFIMACLLDDDDETTTASQTDESRAEASVARFAVSQQSSVGGGWDDDDAASITKSTAASIAVSSVAPPRSKVDDETDDEDLPPVSKAPLFGALETYSKVNNSRKKAVRRRRRTVPATPESDQSQALLSSDDDEAVLDVTARATPPRRRRRIQDDDGSSSPELVYGE